MEAGLSRHTRMSFMISRQALIMLMLVTVPLLFNISALSLLTSSAVQIQNNYVTLPEDIIDDAAAFKDENPTHKGIVGIEEKSKSKNLDTSESEVWEIMPAAKSMVSLARMFVLSEYWCCEQVGHRS